MVEAQPHVFAKNFVAAVDKRIEVALEPFVILPTRITDIENRFDARAKKMTSVDLAAFRAALNKVKADVGVLQGH